MISSGHRPRPLPASTGSRKFCLDVVVAVLFLRFQNHAIQPSNLFVPAAKVPITCFFIHAHISSDKYKIIDVIIVR